MVEVKVIDLCRVLEDLTLKGPQDDWGAPSQELSLMLKALSCRGGMIMLTEISGEAVMAAMHAVVPANFAAALATLEERLGSIETFSFEKTG